MINTIRADLYRIFRMKGFYYTQIILLAMVIPVFFLKDLSPDFKGKSWNAYLTVSYFSSSAVFVVLLSLTLFVITIGTDLNKGTYKNLITTGFSRTQFLFSKYITFLIMTIVQLIIFYLAAFISAWIKHGLGDPPKNFWIDFIKTMGIQTLGIQALFALGLVALMITFSNTTAVVVILLSIATLGVLKILVAPWLACFDFQTLINTAWLTDEFPPHLLLRSILASLGTVLVSLVLSSYIFNKKDC